MSLQSVINYDTAGNFTFSDAAKIEISGGLLRLKDLTPPNVTFAATYNANINGNYGDGVLAGTGAGGAAVAGGKLNLKGGTIKYVDYDANLNADSQQVGTIRLRVIPNYSGNPTTNQNFVLILETAGDLTNLIAIQHQTDGDMVIYYYDQATTAGNTVLGTWSPTSGTEYELELNYDFTSGATRLFIDGTQFGSTIAATLTRSAAIALLRVGTDAGASTAADFEVNSLVIMSAVQHTANYTIGPDAPNTTPGYATDNPTGIVNAGILMDGLDGFVETTSSKAGSDEIKYILEIDGQDTYWNGSAWANSDGTYAQSNTAAEIHANRAVLVLDGTEKTKAFLHSADGTTTPTLTTVTIDYNFAAPAATNPATCIVYGNLADLGLAARSGQTVKAVLVGILHGAGDKTILGGSSRETTTDSNGEWELELPETATDGLKVQFTIAGQNVGSRTIPNQSTATFKGLS